MQIPKKEILELFTQYQVEWYINIVQNSKRSLSYDPLHDEVSYDEKKSISTTLSVIKNHRKSVFRMDGFSLPMLISAFQDIQSVIDFGEYDEDIILPNIENTYRDVHDFSNPTLEDIPFPNLEDLFETVKRFPVSEWIQLESFSVSIYDQTHIFLNSEKIYQEQKTNESSLYIEYFWEYGDVRDTHYLYENTIWLPEITEEKLQKITQELQTKLTARDPFPTGKYTITLDCDVVIEFVDILLGNLGAQSMREGLSILTLKNIGEKILGANVTLINSPTLNGYTGSSAFDGEWIPSKKYTLFQNGVLQSVFCDYKNTQKMNGVFLGNSGVYNIEMVCETDAHFLKESSLLITNLMAFHTVDANTGKFSLAGEWYILKNGEKVGYTKDITLSGNILDLFSNIVAFGDDFKTGGNMKIPSLTIANQTIS